MNLGTQALSGSFWWINSTINFPSLRFHANIFKCGKSWYHLYIFLYEKKKLTIMSNLSHVFRFLQGVLSQKHSITECESPPPWRHQRRNTELDGCDFSPSTSLTATASPSSSLSRLRDDRAFLLSFVRLCFQPRGLPYDARSEREGMQKARKMRTWWVIHFQINKKAELTS